MHLTGAKQFHCTMHRKKNVCKHCDGVTGQKFVSEGNALSYIQKRIIPASEKTETFRVYMEKVAENEQYPIICGFLYGNVTSQGTEVMKNALKNVREAPSATAFILAMKDDKSRHNKARLDAEPLVNGSLSRIVKIASKN